MLIWLQTNKQTNKQTTVKTLPRLVEVIICDVNPSPVAEENAV